jgi:diguanylate cyclase (GGDEF)-like protein/PAS domain S-box-containing protein
MTFSLTRSNTIKYLAIIIIVSIILAVFNNLYKELNQLETKEQIKLESSFELTMQSINSYLDLMRTKVALLAYKQNNLISKLFEDPENFELIDKLNVIVKKQMPDAFGISLANSNGEVIFDDFDGHVGESCRTNIYQFASTKGTYHQIRIHPNSSGYHFDMMIQFSDKKAGKGIFFISFFVKSLVKIFKQNMLPEHQLMLLLQGDENLIEIHNEGSRIDMQRPLHLTETEYKRLNLSAPVVNTLWNLVNLPPEQTNSKQFKQILISHISYIILLSLLSIYMIYSLRLEAKEKRSLQLNNKRLEKKVEERTKEILENNTRFETLINNASDAIISCNEKQEIILFNLAAEKLFDYKSSTLINQPLSILLPDSIQNKHHNLVNSFAQEGKYQSRMKSERSTIEAKRSDGKIIPCEGSISKLQFKESKIYTVFLRDISKRIKAEDKIRRLALTDSLTGLSNRHNFEVQCNKSIAYYKRYPTQVIGLILLDLEHFKPVNDTYGHATGDELLKIVANILISHVRETDIVGRLGGDEFAILVQGIKSEKDISLIAEKLVHELSQPQQIRENTVTIGTSIGISIYSNTDIDLEQFFKQADDALYAAKNSGRSTYFIYHPELLKASDS